MHSQVRHARRSNRLQIETLEARENPSGTVIASLSAGGVLTLTGDSLDNQVQLEVTAAGAVVTGLNETQVVVNGSLEGTVNSINASLKAGNDSIEIIDNDAAGFAITGNALFDLGAGDNSLDLTPIGSLSIGGKLSVKGGTGLDTIDVSGGAGSSIGGGATIALGAGGSSVDISSISISGGAGLKVAAGVGDDSVNLNAVVVDNNIKISTGAGLLNVDIDGATIAGGNVSITGGTVDLDVIGNTFVVGGNFRLAGTQGADLSASAVDAAIHVDSHATISSGVGVAALVATGNHISVGKNLTVSGAAGTNVSIDTTSSSDVAGHVFVRGSAAIDNFDVTSNFSVGKNVLLTLGGGNNLVTLGDGNASLNLNGKISIFAGAGNDTVLFDQVSVAGRTAVRLGSGDDTFQARNGTTFGASASASTLISLGAGADTLNLAGDIAATAGVTFSGRASIFTGDDIDTVTLGVTGGVSPDVIFLAKSVLDGGAATDVFVEATSDFSGDLTIVNLP